MPQTHLLLLHRPLHPDSTFQVVHEEEGDEEEDIAANTSSSSSSSSSSLHNLLLYNVLADSTFGWSGS